METLIHPLSKTELNNKTLWFDGDYTVLPEQITELLEMGVPASKLFVTELTDDIKKYNTLVMPKNQILIKDTVNIPNADWKIPNEYLNLNIKEYLMDLCSAECYNNGWLNDTKHNNKIIQRYKRIEEELTLYTKFNLFPILRVIIFIINTLRTQKIVWGIGRGSSVSSYILYLIGAHDVDSVEYDIDITDFLRLK